MDFNYNEDMSKYKTKACIYLKYKFLENLTGNQIISLGLESHKLSDYEFASACRALILLDKEKFKKE